MKKFLGFLGTAILGGAITLGGYQILSQGDEPIRVNNDEGLRTYQANYVPSKIDVSTVDYAPTSFAEAADKTIHAVVHVKNTAIKSGPRNWADFFNGSRRYEQVGTGSGVIISSDGYIATNNHVIDGANSIEITLNNNKKYKAELIGTDTKNDIALLKIDADDKLPYIPFSDSDYAKIGDWVLAVGNPYNLTSTVTAGIISAKGRDLKGNGTTIDSFIQTDAAVNPGNSGGALVNTRGELVGINTAITSKTGSYVGYSFAVPSNIVKKVVDDILEFGIVQEAVLGISVPNEKQENIDGVFIGEFPEESEAKKAGLKVGDIITKVNDVKISKFSELSGQLKAKRPGDYVNVTVNREGKNITKKVKLSKKDTFVSYILGLQLKDISKKEMKSLDIKNGAKIAVSRNETFNYYGVKEGSVIISINKAKVTSAQQAVILLESAYRNRSRISIELINTDGELERYVFN